MADTKVELKLSFDELAIIEMRGNIEASEGTPHGMDNEVYGNFQRKCLDNRTVSILNDIIDHIRAEPIEQTALEGMMSEGTTNSWSDEQFAIAEQFGNFFYELAKAQIYVPEGELGIPKNNPTTVGYPLRDVLDSLASHKLQHDHGMIVENGKITEREHQPIWDYMQDDDDEITNSFWYIIKMLSLVA